MSKNLRSIRESRIQNRSIERLSFQTSGNNSQIVMRDGKQVVGRVADRLVYLDMGVFDVL